MIHICLQCGHTYDEETGIPELGISPGTPFADLPGDWACPFCGAGKDFFSSEDE